MVSISKSIVVISAFISFAKDVISSGIPLLVSKDI